MLRGVKVMVALIIGLLFVMVPETMQLHVNHPLYSAVQRVNDKAQANGVDFLGLILTSQTDEKYLLSSGYFQHDSSIPYITIAGRKYNIGLFNNILTVYVLAGDPLAAVGVTVQILLDTFKVGSIISTGASGSLADRVSIGDVGVIQTSAYTGVWNWQEWEEADLRVSKTPNATLTFGDYNYPEAGDNKLANVKFTPVSRFTPAGTGKKTTFWFTISQNYQKLATKLKDLELEKCVEETVCLVEEPKVVTGLKASSSDVYVYNEAYAKFLYNKLGVSIADRQSAAVAATAYANGMPYFLIRGATNKPGKQTDKRLSALAYKNSIKVTAAFAELIANPSSTINYYQD